MKHFLRIILFLLLLISVSLKAQDDDLPRPMSPARLVNDFTKTFNSVQREDIEQTLKAYNDSTSTQIYVVTVANLQGYDISDYAARLGEKWGIGQKEKNNGVLILIKPRIGNEGGQVYIATGYGVEHILNDGRVGRIIDQYMIPYLRNGDYYNATKGAIDAIIKYLSGEFAADETNEESIAPVIVQIIVILLILLFLYIGSKNNRGGGSGGSSGPWRGGYFGGGSGRSGGSSWGGGGSFGGGGGGSFGGGGAGRSF